MIDSSINMKVKIYSILLGFLPLAALVLAGGCIVHETETSGTNGNGDMSVVIRAFEEVMGNATRANDMENTQVKNRKMLFTYPSPPFGEMKSALCKFDADGYGYVYAGSEEGDPLKWKDVYTEKPGGCDVYLDNLLDYPVQVPDPESDDVLKKYYDNFIQIEFGPGDDIHGEKVMVAEAGSKEAENGIDIVWGKIGKAESGKSLHFVLEHKMSQVTFRFYSENENIREALEGDGITVSLDKIRKSVFRWAMNHPRPDRLPAFCRSNGTIDQAQGVNPFEKAVLFSNKESLKKIENEAPMTYYSTHTLVMPPRTYEYSTAGNLPKLTIELNDGSKYSGTLPQTIQYWMTDNKTGESVLMTTKLFFKSGYHFIFDVKLVDNLGEREILFQDITVGAWVFKYNDEFTMSESGINTWEDFTALAKVFNEDYSEKNYRLMKYGQWNADKEMWGFKLWNDITVSGDFELPQFDNGNFEIDFGLRKITVGDKVINSGNYKFYLVKK
ncbi:putative uncharacterized protein [Odoribacter laneus CAG:561]|nr:putative uncharacterized protein [Odoribacter laneus CAG:561]